MENSNNKFLFYSGRKSSKNEHGRAIIDMIAVVVIISVLTVLGVMLYWYVLNRQKVNSLTEEVGSMALTTSIKLSQANPNLQIQGNLEYPYTGTINDNKTFTITVSNIPGSMCRILKADKWSLPYETKVNNDLYGECQKENELSFSFHNSLYDGAHPELEQEQEEPEQKINYCRPACQAGCKETCKTNKYWCWSDGCACLNGKANPPQCTQDPPCSQELIELHDCEGNSFTCCPDYYMCEEPICESGENTCSVDIITVHNCDGTTSKCCPDNGTDCSDPTDCCDPGECMGINNVCINHHCTCAIGYTKDADGNCGTCPTTTVFRPTNANECNNCNTVEHPYQMKHGLCEPAPTCKNDSDCTYMYGFCLDGICGCPAEGYFRNKNGNCTICTEKNNKLTFKEECDLCDNRYFSYDNCRLCGSNKYVDITRTSCNSCPTDGSIFKPLDESVCSKCSSTEYPYQMIGNICKPRKTCSIDADCGQYRYCVDGICGCPEGYFQNKNGNCTLCTDNTAKEKETFDEECAKCNGIRQMVNGKCTLM